MARLTLSGLCHSYHPRPPPQPADDADWALKRLDLDLADGGAFALLGPSGCGKTTLLNLLSGLLVPTGGHILFDGRDVTALPPEQRHIAQIFQFPVVYDTMTVFGNLAFPLRNHGVDPETVRNRVHEIAAMTGLTDVLHKRAAGLSADGKQKISLGRGLVRTDVNAILFDEPLTVIDSHLKFQLRSKLRELHQRVGHTMIYVTHDQTEALTFADRVVVMNMGEVVQVGTPEALFEAPQHVFVGNFIGSPGMNVLPCQIENGRALVAGTEIPTANRVPASDDGHGRMEIGVRPEYVSLSGRGRIVARVVKVADAGRYRIVETRWGEHRVNLLAPEGAEIPAETARLDFAPESTRLYRDGWLVDATA